MVFNPGRFILFMGKFSLLLDSIVASANASSSTQENNTLNAKQEEKTQAVVYNNHESYNYSKYTNSFINLYINGLNLKGSFTSENLYEAISV